jgi:hypothetical protein
MSQHQVTAIAVQVKNVLRTAATSIQDRLGEGETMTEARKQELVQARRQELAVASAALVSRVASVRSSPDPWELEHTQDADGNWQAHPDSIQIRDHNGNLLKGEAARVYIRAMRQAVSGDPISALRIVHDAEVTPMVRARMIDQVCADIGNDEETAELLFKVFSRDEIKELLVRLGGLPNVLVLLAPKKLVLSAMNEDLQQHSSARHYLRLEWLESFKGRRDYRALMAMYDLGSEVLESIKVAYNLGDDDTLAEIEDRFDIDLSGGSWFTELLSEGEQEELTQVESDDYFVGEDDEEVEQWAVPTDQLSPEEEEVAEQANADAEADRIAAAKIMAQREKQAETEVQKASSEAATELDGEF